MKKPTCLLTALVLLFCFSAAAQLVNTKGDFTTNDVAPRSFKFKPETGSIVAKLLVRTHPGTVSFEVRSPDGAIVGKQSAGVATINAWSLNVTNAGNYELVVTPHKTAGHWEARIDQVPAVGALYAQVASGALMMLVALVAVFFWKFKSRVQWRWFWAGAAIWTVGVALKFAVALPLNPIFFAAMKFSAGWNLGLGSAYLGLLTGIFEIGVTLAAALIWRRLAADPARALAVGLGAGAFEALLLGLAAFAGSIAALASGQTELVLKSLTVMAAQTSLLWLTGPAERVIAILAHTASRVLVLRAVAGRTWFGAWAGFVWLSALDAVAGLALLTGMTASGSMWRIELMLLPFGILSIPLILWAIRRWPTTTNGGSELSPLPPEISVH